MRLICVTYVIQRPLGMVEDARLSLLQTGLNRFSGPKSHEELLILLPSVHKDLVRKCGVQRRVQLIDPNRPTVTLTLTSTHAGPPSIDGPLR